MIELTLQAFAGRRPIGRSLQSRNHSYRGINRRRKVSGSWRQPQRKPAPAGLDLCAYPEKGFSAPGAVKTDKPIFGCGSEETSRWVGGRFYGSCQFNFGTIHISTLLCPS